MAAIRKVPTSPAQTFRNIASAIGGMPLAMRQMALAMFCQWYAMFVTGDLLRCDRAFAIGAADSHSSAYHEATLVIGQVGAFCNFVAFAAAFALVPFARSFCAKPVHAHCLVASGSAMLVIPPKRTGIYMGIFMFIVIPMLIRQ